MRCARSKTACARQQPQSRTGSDALPALSRQPWYAGADTWHYVVRNIIAPNATEDYLFHKLAPRVNLEIVTCFEICETFILTCILRGRLDELGEQVVSHLR